MNIGSPKGEHRLTMVVESRTYHRVYKSVDLLILDIPIRVYTNALLVDPRLSLEEFLVYTL